MLGSCRDLLGGQVLIHVDPGDEQDEESEEVGAHLDTTHLPTTKTDASVRPCG